MKDEDVILSYLAYANSKNPKLTDRLNMADSLTLEKKDGKYILINHVDHLFNKEEWNEMLNIFGNGLPQF